MRNEVVKVSLFLLFILSICRPQVVEFGVNQSNRMECHVTTKPLWLKRQTYEVTSF